MFTLRRIEKKNTENKNHWRFLCFLLVYLDSAGEKSVVFLLCFCFLVDCFREKSVVFSMCVSSYVDCSGEKAVAFSMSIFSWQLSTSFSTTVIVLRSVLWATSWNSSNCCCWLSSRRSNRCRNNFKSSWWRLSLDYTFQIWSLKL